MSSHPIFGSMITRVESICKIEYARDGSCSLSYRLGAGYHNFLFWLVDSKLVISSGLVDPLTDLSDIAKLFYMDKIIVDVKSSDKIRYEINNLDLDIMKMMNFSYMSNRLYCMVFVLALTNTSRQIKKYRMSTLEKFKLLKASGQFPIELCIEIFSYLIEFILMCM